MIKHTAALLGAAALAVLSGTAAARTNIDVGIGFGVPAPVYVAPRPAVTYYPAPVYAPAPPVYVAPAPVYGLSTTITATRTSTRCGPGAATPSY